MSKDKDKKRNKNLMATLENMDSIQRMRKHTLDDYDVEEVYFFDLDFIRQTYYEFVSNKGKLINV